VLCVSKNARSEIVVLLGKEREVPGWKHGSLKWCGFSGRAEEGETPLASASREFLEESCSTVMLTENATVPARADEVSLALQTATPVSHTVKAPPPSEEYLYHVTYLCKVPFDKGAPDRFLRVQEDLKRVDAVFRAFYRLKKALENVPRFFFPGFSVAEGFVTVNVRTDVRENLVFVEFFDRHSAEPSTMKTWKTQVSPLVAKEAAELSEAWAEVTSFVEKECDSLIFSHPAVLLTRHQNVLISAYVNRCYLEKTELAWFRLEDLEAADRWKTREEFRRHFLDALRSFGPQIRTLFADDLELSHEDNLSTLVEEQETAPLACVC